MSRLRIDGAGNAEGFVVNFLLRYHFSLIENHQNDRN